MRNMINKSKKTTTHTHIELVARRFAKESRLSFLISQSEFYAGK